MPPASPFHASRLAIALVLGLVPTALPAQQATPEVTMEAIEAAWNAGDFATARAGLVAYAEAGDAKAQYRLGFMMANASGGPYDPDGAKRWLEAALAGGHNAGHVLLARLYLSHNPEAPDYQRAAELLAIAVEAGEAEAHFYLGQLYRLGRGVQGDKARAFELLRKAASAGVADAQYALSEMYSRGEGVGKDDAQAARWLLSAGEAGSGQAQMSLYFNYSRGTGFPKDESIALAWLEAAANSRVTLAERILGSAFLVGEGVEADPERAHELLNRAAAKGDPGAETNLGYAYARGIGVEKDMSVAAKWYRKAADQGLTRAAVVMGQLFEAGSGVDVDLAQAMHYYRIAWLGRDEVAPVRLGALVIAGALGEAEEPEQAIVWVADAAEAGIEGARDWMLARAATGEPYAWYRLGLMSRDGKGTEADPIQAADHFHRAAEAGFGPAQLEMAQAFATGAGVAQDFVEAHKWANLAASAGVEGAADKRDTFADLMTPDQVAEAQDRARVFLGSH